MDAQNSALENTDILDPNLLVESLERLPTHQYSLLINKTNVTDTRTLYGRPFSYSAVVRLEG